MIKRCMASWMFVVLNPVLYSTMVRSWSRSSRYVKMCARRRLVMRRASFNGFQFKFGGRDGGIPVPLGAAWAFVLGSAAAMLFGWDTASLGGNTPSECSIVGVLTKVRILLAIYETTISLLHQHHYKGSLLGLERFDPISKASQEPTAAETPRALTFWSEFVFLSCVVRDRSMLDWKRPSICSNSRFDSITSDRRRIARHEANNTVIYWGMT